MKSFELLNVNQQDNIAHIEILWPQPQALSMLLINELQQLFHYLEDESDCSLIVLKGSAQQQPPSDSQPPDLDIYNKWEKLLYSIENYNGASLMIIEDYCSHFHFQLSLACDYRIAAQGTIFHSSEIKQGFLPGMALYRLTKITTMSWAKRILFTGQPITAKQAHDSGLIDHCYPANELEHQSLQQAKALLPSNRESYRNARRLLHECYASNYQNALGNFLAVQNLCLYDINQNQPA